MYKCNQCDKQFISAQKLGGHLALMIRYGKHIKTSNKPENIADDKYKINNDQYKCPHCEKIFSKKGFGSHVWRMHGSGIEHSPNKNRDYTNSEIWNKGKTKETDNRIKVQCETYKQNIENGTHIPHQTGKPLTKETKDKISKARLKYLMENPDKVPYLLNHSSKMSYPEKAFIDYLNKFNITDWIYQKQFSIYQLDFAFEKYKLDVEIDGQTHEQEKVKIIDQRRDLYLQNNGWNVLRITAKELRKNIYSCIIRVLNKINITPSNELLEAELERNIQNN